MFESACGIASTPAPTIVLTKFMTDEPHDAEPEYTDGFTCRVRRVCEAAEGGLDSAARYSLLLIAAYVAMIRS
jgi:hypothetical protein